MRRLLDRNAAVCCVGCSECYSNGCSPRPSWRRPRSSSRSSINIPANASVASLNAASPAGISSQISTFSPPIHHRRHSVLSYLRRPTTPPPVSTYERVSGAAPTPGTRHRLTPRRDGTEIGRRCARGDDRTGWTRLPCSTMMSAARRVRVRGVADQWDEGRVR